MSGRKDPILPLKYDMMTEKKGIRPKVILKRRAAVPGILSEDGNCEVTVGASDRGAGYLVKMTAGVPEMRACIVERVHQRGSPHLSWPWIVAIGLVWRGFSALPAPTAVR